MFIYATPIFQRASSNASGLQCIIALVILGVAWAVLANLNSKTKNTAPYSRTVTTSFTREQIINLVERAFPKSMISKGFNWEPSWPAPHKFTMSGYYLTNGQGCLTLLLTGIIPGYLVLKLAMERSEEVAVDFAEFESGQLTLGAKGLRAQREVDKLADRLERNPEINKEPEGAEK